jgi:acetolactate synthase I/II/III large subunit
MAKFSFNASKDDVRMLTNLMESDFSSNNISQNLDYSNYIVRKPWGYEYLVYENDEIAIWMLHIARKRGTSMHCHPNKTTNLILLSGQLRCEGLKWKKDLNQLDFVRIDKGVFHSSKALSSENIYPPSENGSFLIEIESPVDKGDLVRAKDSYGRKGKSYEGIDSMLEYSKDMLEVPKEAKDLNDWKHKLLDLEFSLKTLDDIQRNFFGADFNDGLFIPIKSFDNSLMAGEVLSFSEVKKINSKNLDQKFIIIKKERNSIKLSDYVSTFISNLGVKEIFAVSGGGAMHLVDSFGSNPDIQYIAVHHEQAAAMAAESYSRISNNIGSALFTTGPGGTNAITGLAGAWIDSIPVIYISGQVTSDTLSPGTGLRQFGIQESDIVNLVKPITKYAVSVQDKDNIRYELEKAYSIAISGRPGPVWIDIPLDIQSKQIIPVDLKKYSGQIDDKLSKPSKYIKDKVSQVKDLIKKSKRPVLITGYGVRLSHSEIEVREIAEYLRIPIVSSWTSSDLFSNELDYYIGRAGIFGDRASNFAVQNSDLLIIIGSRMSVPQTGYNFSTFSRESKKIMVDIDENEINKPSLNIDLPIVADVKSFLLELDSVKDTIELHNEVNEWRSICSSWKNKYPVVLPQYKNQKKYVNSFYFVNELSKVLDKDAVIVTDMGTSYTCTMQTFKIKSGQRLTTSSGHASMGFGLPGAVGACFANNKEKVICISGEGGLQMNIQELQTIAHNKLPVILFVLNNGGYLTIKSMQQNHFGKFVGSEVSSGVSFPSMKAVSHAYKIPFIRVNNHIELESNLSSILENNSPFICEIMMDEEQPLIPRSSSMKQPDGSIKSKPIEDLYPFLDREEFLSNMIIPPLEEI